MSNASAAREPSMDEILASIRRIIETGDDRPGIGPAARKPAEFAAAKSAADGLAEAAKAPGEPGFAGRLADEGSSRAPAGEAATARPARADRQRPDPVLPAARPPERMAAGWAVPGELRQSLTDNLGEATRSGSSLRSVQPAAVEGGMAARPAAAERPRTRPEADGAGHDAHRNAEISRHDESKLAEPTSGNEPLRQTAKVVDMRSFNLELDEAEFAAELLNETGLGGADVAAAAAGYPEPSVSKPETSWATARTDDDEEPAARRFDNDPKPDRLRSSARYEAEFGDAETAAPLLSSSAGQQVAAAFDDLSEAIRLGQMKSMEEMAREMLRPMLQEWLDDNLPRLVERLVREEIERVARGGGR